MHPARRLTVTRAFLAYVPFYVPSYVPLGLTRRVGIALAGSSGQG
jgi:hypothetical protein